MPMRHLFTLLLLCITILLHGQDKHFMAVNPVLFSYSTEDVYINPPQKYNNGTHLLSPDPKAYPWEERLENGMPNALVDANGNVSVYFSSFIIFSPTPPSKVGVMVFTNTTSNLASWTRPDAGLYWYNPAGKTADEKISATYKAGYKSTNLVAVDIESLGIFDDGTSTKPIKLIYMPQREFQYKYLGAYEMDRSFTAGGILSGFAALKNDRLQKQKVFTFRNINADTHMNWMRHDGKYFFTSRVNSRRSALKPGETPPFTTDPRKRFRRSTITEVGSQIVTKNLDFNVALDYSTKQWEPYGMQPFRLPGFESDVWLGLVTMYGVEGNPGIEKKQRTELAISNNGKDWYYLKPGTPFLANGTNPQSDDYGCINIATPVYRTKFHSGRNPNDPFFFYASSRIGHEEGRNPGISLATSKYGKLAGLKATSEKLFYSATPLTAPGLTFSEMPQFSIKNAFAIDAEFCPSVLGDVTDDPVGKMLTQLNSYIAIRMFTYNVDHEHGLGTYLGGTLGSSKPGTHTVSDDYMSVGFIASGIDGSTKANLLKYLKSCSEAEPGKIISIKDFKDIPVVFETRVKNATFYGVKFKGAKDKSVSINIDKANDFKPLEVWNFKPSAPLTPSSDCHVEDFSNNERIPNQMIPTQMESGSFALKVNPKNATNDQTIFRMFGDADNYISMDYLSNGSFRYHMVKEGTDYLNMQIAPPAGKSFQGKDVIVTIEAVKQGDRKYDKEYKEETTLMRVSCPGISFNKVLSQEIIWNFRRDTPTPVDSCYARGFAYLPFSAFIGNMNKIVVGGSSESCENKFAGSIYQVEVAEKLPTGASDFWNNASTRSAQPIVTDIDTDDMDTYVSVYPNPIKKNGILHLEVGAEQTQRARVELIDFSGRVMKGMDVDIQAGQNNLDIDVQGVVPGIYILTFNSGDINVTRKIIIVD